MISDTDTSRDRFTKRRRINMQPSGSTHLTPPRANSLDGLPIELKVAILASLPDIPTLHALVKASPSYHQSYLGQRQFILSTVLTTELTPSVLLEAEFVLSAAKIVRRGSEEDWIAEVDSFIEDCDLRRNPKNHENPAAVAKDLETWVSLVRLHSSIRAIYEDFCHVTVSKHPITGQDLTIEDCSTNERRRIFRACYRFESFCYLFRNLMWDSVYDLGWGAQIGVRIGALFFRHFNVWEVEEIYCIRDYIYRRYDTIFKDSQDELHNFFFRLEERDGFPGQTEDDVLARMGETTWLVYRDLTEGLMSSGLEFLSELITLPSSKDRVYMIEDDIGGVRGFGTASYFLTNALKGYASAQNTSRLRAETPPSWEARFVNDDKEDGPNAAWPWSSSIVGDQWHCALIIARNAVSLRSWGYVMWDISRLKSLNMLENEASSYGEHGPQLSHGKLLSSIDLNGVSLSHSSDSD